MDENPSTDLLIFKLRGQKKEEKRSSQAPPPPPQPKPPATPPPQPPKPAAQKPTPPAQQPQQPRPSFWSFNNRPEEKPVQKVEQQRPVQKVEQPSPVQAAPKPTPPPPPPPQRPEPARQQRQPVQRQELQKAPEEQDVSKLKCISHPWREAYAICSVCNLPFCYADIMKYGNKFYCLADIGKAESMGEKTAERPHLNIFNYGSSLLFVANAALLSYFLYPQVEFLITYVSTSGTMGLVENLIVNYPLQTANASVIIFSAIAALLSLTKSTKTLFAALIVAGLSMALTSYEFVTTGSTYLVAATAISLVCVSTLAFSRMSSARALQESEQVSVQPVEWPTPGVGVY